MWSCKINFTHKSEFIKFNLVDCKTNEARTQILSIMEAKGDSIPFSLAGPILFYTRTQEIPN